MAMDEKRKKGKGSSGGATTAEKKTLGDAKLPSADPLVFSYSVGSLNGFEKYNVSKNAKSESWIDTTSNTNTNAAKSESQKSPYSVPDSPEVQSVKATLGRIANHPPVKAVLVFDQTGKLAHVQYPSSGVTDFDARHMKMDYLKLLMTQADDFIRDINPQSFLKTLRLRGKNNAVVMEVEEDKSTVLCVQRCKFVPLISKQHI